MTRLRRSQQPAGANERVDAAVTEVTRVRKPWWVESDERRERVEPLVAYCDAHDLICLRIAR